MKMISSTSITSMYGTTLISALSLRRLWRRMLRMIQCARGSGGRFVGRGSDAQDRGELFDEHLVARSACARPWWRSGCTPTPPESRRTGPSRSRSALRKCGRDHRDGRVLDVGQALERDHDAPDGAEQADVRADRADVGEEFEVAVPGGRSRACRRTRIARCAPSSSARESMHATLAQAREFAEARLRRSSSLPVMRSPRLVTS